MRGLGISQARSSELELLSEAANIKSLNGRELIDRRATYSRTIVDKLQICHYVCTHVHVHVHV